MNSSLTEGNGFRTVLRFSLPLILGAFIQQLYSVTDSLIVGNLVGSEALAAIGATGSSIFFLFSINSGLSSACSVVIAQNLGAGSREKVTESIVSTIYYTLICTLVISSLGMACVEPLLRLLQTPEDILPQASLYLKIYVGAALGQILYNNMAAVLRAFGDSRTPLLFLIFCTVLNVGLDFLVVAGLGMGVAGAAIATVLSQIISGALCLWYAVWKYPVFRLRRKDWRPSFPNIRQIAAIGIPMALQTSVLSVGDMIVSGIINSYGTAMVAAYSAASKIHQFCVTPFLQFAIAFCTFAAQNIGAGKVQRIRTTMRSASVFVVATSLTLGFCVRMMRDPLLSMFISADDPLFDQVLRIGGDFLNLIPPLYPFIALIWLYNYMLRGVGETRIPLLSGGIELASKILLPLMLGRMFGDIGVWYGFPLCWILGWIPSVLYYAFGRWPERYREKHEAVSI